MQTETTIIICTPDPQLAETAVSLEARGYRAIVGTTSQQVTQVMLSAGPCLVVLDDALPFEKAWGIYDVLARRGDIPSLMLTDASSYQRLALNTARPALEDYAVKPLRSDELLHRVSALVVRAGLPVPPTPRAVEQELVTIKAAGGQITAVYGLKGGVGKSTIATNLAVNLARTHGASVLLVDADLYGGQAGVLLNQEGRRTSYDLCMREVSEPETLRELVTRHSSGVDVLLRPHDLVTVEHLQTSYLLEALPTYARMYDHVIIDMSSAVDEFNQSILDAADRILLVTTPEVPSLSNTSRFLGVCEHTPWAPAIKVVLNRAGAGVDMEAVERVLRRKPSALVPSDGKTVVRAANEGKPLCEADPQQRSAATRALVRLSDLVAGRARPTVLDAVKSSFKVFRFGASRPATALKIAA